MESKPLLSDEQVEYINKLGLPFVVTEDLSLLSDEEFWAMSDAVADYLMSGFDKDCNPNEIALIGESIMNFIGVYF